MLRQTAKIVTGAALTGATAAALVVGAHAAGAANSCTAWATMPTTVRTHATTPASLTMTLHGTAGCQGATFDNGATAYLVSPSGRERIFLRWDRFGAVERQELYANLDESGTWRIVQGSTQTYDADYEHIASTWQSTAVRVLPAKPKPVHA